MHTLTHNSQVPSLESRSSPALNPALPVNPPPPAIPARLVNPSPGRPRTKPIQHTVSSPPAKSAPKPTHVESEQGRDPHGRVLRNPSQGWYCAVCYTNVTTLGLTVKNPSSIDENLKTSLTIDQKQKNHARNCKTSFQEFLALTKGEVAQRKSAVNSVTAKTAADDSSSLIESTARITPSKAARVQGNNRAKATGAYRPEPTNDSSVSESEEKERKKRKRKSASGTKTPSSRKRPHNRDVVG